MNAKTPLTDYAETVWQALRAGEPIPDPPTGADPIIARIVRSHCEIEFNRRPPRICMACAKPLSDVRPASAGAPAVCVPCATGHALSEVPQESALGPAYPAGRWTTKPKA